jgi:hypothetical protein
MDIYSSAPVYLYYCGGPGRALRQCQQCDRTRPCTFEESPALCSEYRNSSGKYSSLKLSSYSASSRCANRVRNPFSVSPLKTMARGTIIHIAIRENCGPVTSTSESRTHEPRTRKLQSHASAVAQGNVVRAMSASYQKSLYSTLRRNQATHATTTKVYISD